MPIAGSATSSAAAQLAQLEERDAALKAVALKRLNHIVDEFWPEVYESIEVMYVRNNVLLCL
jgi:hypothetical protein